MSTYLRPRAAGATIFFTVNLAHRGTALLTERVDLLRDAVQQTKAERPFEIEAWVVLPDHLHCIWTLPLDDSGYSVRWGAIKSRFSIAVRRAGFTPPNRLPVVALGRYAGVNPDLRVAKGEVGIWQRRFWEHHIRDEADFIAHLRYCWMNPVKRWLVERPEDWPHSSVHRDERFQKAMDLFVGRG
jgi:putative transposase